MRGNSWWAVSYTHLDVYKRQVLISTHMIDSIEDFWDVAYIMNRGKIVSVKRNGDGGGTLEDMFFAATEGEKHE